MATELAKAYVQILPSARGMKSNLTKILDNEMPDGTASGEKLGDSLVKGIKKVVAAAGIGKLIKDTLSEGAALEQSVGGVETLFKESSEAVISNARNAYTTAGLSANEYMETVTSFAASLLQGLGGDTAEAADIADRAITDMSDNANKMGTSMESIQNAYQGFAKQNYTMLDNLKLGYGGTAGEMARLINDSGVLGDKIKVTNKTVNEVPFDKIIEAIGVIQDRLGITGTTAKEAASTFSGSLSSMRASVKNLLGALASGEGVEEATDAFVSTAETFLGENFIPMLGRVLNSAGQFLIEAVKNAPEFLSKLVKELDFDSAAALFAVTTAPKAAKALLSVFKENTDVRSSLSKSGQTIGDQIGSSTAGTAESTAASFSQKFSKGLSAASAVISAAVIGWDIGTVIYNCAKPGIDKVTDALVDAFNADTDAMLTEKEIEAEKKWRVAELKQKGAYWLTSADWNNDFVINRAAEIVGKATTYGLDVNKVYSVYYDLEGNASLIEQRLQRLSANAKTSGNDLSNNFAQGMQIGAKNIWDATNAVASQINSVLGFSEPETGPLSDFHTYAPDMMQLYAKGIADNKHLVEDEVVSLMNGVKGTMTEPVGPDLASGLSDGTASRVIVLRLTDNAGRLIAEGTVDDIDELQGASVLLSERGLA